MFVLSWAKLPRVKWLVCVNICLLFILCAVLVFLFMLPELRSKGNSQDYYTSTFVYTEKFYDINPGQEYVLYTNYACPFCAVFYANTQEMSYTTRLLVLDGKEGRFLTQDTVSAYMLKLSRHDTIVFREAEALLFQAQDEWTALNEREVIEWLNQRTAMQWRLDDLQSEIAEIRVVEAEAPDDLVHIPALYTNGKRYDGFVQRITEKQ